MSSTVFPSYFRLISNPIHSIFFGVTSSVSVAANCLLIYAIFASKCKEIGNYRYLLLCFALCDIVTSIMHFVALPIIHMTSSGYWFFPRNDGIFRTKGGKLATAITFTYVATYYQIFLILSYHFVYRARMLARDRPIFDGWKPWKWAALGIAVNVLFIGIFMRASYTNMAPDYSRRTAPDMFVRLYNINVSDPDVGFFHITWKRENAITGELEWYLPTIIAMSVSGMLTIGTGAVIGVSIWLIARSMKSHAMAEKTRKMQQLFFRALLIQTAAPLIFAYVPLSVIICLPLAGIDGGALGTIFIMITAVFPLMDALIVIFFIPRFRSAVLQLLRLSSLPFANNNSSVRSISEASVVSARRK